MGGNESAAVRYRIDAGQSRFVVRAFADGLLSVFGHNPTVAICGFGGDARFVPDTLQQASLLMLVSADSLAVTGDMSEKDRREMERMMREDVLEIARYPEIVFMCTKVTAHPKTKGRYRTEIVGDLSLHGVTREHLIEAEVTIDGDGLRAQGEFSLRQSEHDIERVSVAGGTLKIKDELKISFDIVAHAQVV